MSEEKKEKAIDIELPEDVAEGEYSNLAIITHSDAEFILDFVKILPGVPKGKVKSRILLTPQHAKRLMNALSDNIAKFESVHGKIEDKGNKDILLNFGGPTAQA